MRVTSRMLLHAALISAAAGVAAYIVLETKEPNSHKAQEEIGTALRRAVAILEAAPPVPALKQISNAGSAPISIEDEIQRQAQVRNGDISQIRRDLPGALLRFESGEISESATGMAVSAAHGPFEKAFPALDRWIAEEPNSYAALVTRGIVRHRYGWHLRGGDYVVYTPKENLADMSRLQALAVEDFVAALSKTKYPVMAVDHLISIAVAQGWGEEAKKLYLAGERLSPSSDELFGSYKQILYGEWGTGSLPAAKAFLRRAEENGVSLEARSELMRHLLNMESANRYSIGQPDALPNAVAFCERYGTIDAWWWRSKVESSVGRYEDSLKSLLHVIEKYPTSTDALGDMVTLLRKLNRPDAVKAIMRRTADLGNDWAQGEIIGDMIWERNGEKRDWPKIRKECEMSAEMRNPSGQNCVGGLYSDGLAGYPKNNAKAIKYYELAARQGNDRAQHDYGWMLIQGMGVKADREKGVFYLRNSARQNFEPALGKLKQLGERTDNLEWKATPLETAKRNVERMLDRGATWAGRY